MTGFDIVLRSAKSDHEIAIALSSGLGTALNEVLIQEEYSGDSIPSNIRIICSRSEVEGDFVQQLSVDIIDTSIRYESIDVAILISKDLNSDCLLPSGDDNPYAMKLISSTGTVKSVMLAATEFEEGSYRIK